MTCRKQFDEEYAVAEARVTLSIVYGDAQLGSSLVKLDDERLAKGSDITDLSIGDGPAIAGKKLRLKSVVTDVNDMTNHTSVTYVLKGGKEDREFSYDCTVQQEGDSAIYRGTIGFTS